MLSYLYNLCTGIYTNTNNIILILLSILSINYTCLVFKIHSLYCLIFFVGQFIELRNLYLIFINDK